MFIHISVNHLPLSFDTASLTLGDDADVPNANEAILNIIVTS